MKKKIRKKESKKLPKKISKKLPEKIYLWSIDDGCGEPYLVVSESVEAIMESSGTLIGIYTLEQKRMLNVKKCLVEG